MSNTITLVEKHVISKTSSKELYNLIQHYCREASDLYNSALFLLRQNMIHSADNEVYTYNKLEELCKTERTHDYYALPAQSAQQTIKEVTRNVDAYFKAIKTWSKNKDKFLGRPRFPKYKKRSKLSNFYLTNQQAVLKIINDEAVITYPKIFGGYRVRPRCVKSRDFINYVGVRFVPKTGYINMEIIYKVSINDLKLNKDNCLAIDPGVNNLVTCVTNLGLKPFVIDGKAAKSFNKYFNKLLSKEKARLSKQNLRSSNETRRLYKSRTLYFNDYFHKVTSSVIEYCLAYDIGTIVFGHSNYWKNKSKMSKLVNQSFVQLPFNDLIKQLEYKCVLLGINFIVQEESYTSKASFFDNDVVPVYDKNFTGKHEFSGYRVTRGLYKTKSGRLVNADVNGAFNILVKSKQGFRFNPNELCIGCVSHPVRVSVGTSVLQRVA